MNSSFTQSCYRLPWTTYNNPNGWIEPTTYCQLRCPGCYRGCDKDHHKAIHVPLENMIHQVDMLIEKRNIHTLSISGGDPLLYPALSELLFYAYSRGLRIMIFTNGIALNEKILKQLKSNGVSQIIIHVDKFQDRTKSGSIGELNALRNEYCLLFRKVGGVNLGFIQPLTPDCLQDIPAMNLFFSQNRDIINLVVYTLYREIYWDHKHKPEIDTKISMSDVLHVLCRDHFIEPASYLPGTVDKTEPAWVFSYSVGTKNSLLGFLDSNVYEVLQSRYYKKKKRYFFISATNRVKKWGLIKLAGYRSIRKILYREIVTQRFSPDRLYFQTCLVIRGPQKSGELWDLCDGCPDAMLFNGQLEPSCILEEIKNNPKLSKVEPIHYES